MFFSLPVSVRNYHPLGYWLTPILVDILSKQIGEKAVFCYGKLGLRAPSPEEEVRFHENLDFLKITTERVTDVDFLSDLQTISDRACSLGKTISRVQECYLCPCGALSIPVAIVEYSREKTFKRLEGVLTCKVCNKEAVVSSVQSLFYMLSAATNLKSIRVFPALYQKEINELQRQIHEQGIPISKTRLTGFTFDDWNVDIEFLWSFLPLVMFNQNNERVKAVVTNQVLRQVVTSYLLAMDLNPEFEADLVVSPIIIHPGKVEKWNLDRLKTLGYDGDLLRFVLLSSLGWNQKEANLYDSVATVEHRRFNLLKHAVKVAESKSYDIQETIRNLRQENLVSGLSNVFNPERFDYKTFKGLF